MKISYTAGILKILWTGILIGAVCLSPGITAAEGDNATTPDMAALPEQNGEPITGDASQPQDEPIEEILIIGQERIFDLRKQIYRAEDRAFELFNAMNDDDRYDIHCWMQARIGTLIKKRMCLPNFYKTAAHDNAMEFLGFLGETTIYGAASMPARAVYAQQYPILLKKLKEFALVNPDLLDALRESYELNMELKKERNAYHGIHE